MWGCCFFLLLLLQARRGGRTKAAGCRRARARWSGAAAEAAEGGSVAPGRARHMVRGGVPALRSAGDPRGTMDNFLAEVSAGRAVRLPLGAGRLGGTGGPAECPRPRRSAPGARR